MSNPWDPTWQPNRVDVRYDPVAAQNAISALNAAAADVDAVTKERIERAGTARRWWQGRYRKEFDKRFDATVSTAHRLADDLRQAAARLQQAGAQAQQEQQQRQQDRARWDREQADSKVRYDQAHQPPVPVP
jgi:uncharacterized protein YukE